MIWNPYLSSISTVLRSFRTNRTTHNIVMFTGELACGRMWRIEPQELDGVPSV